MFLVGSSYNHMYLHIIYPLFALRFPKIFRHCNALSFLVCCLVVFFLFFSWTTQPFSTVSVKKMNQLNSRIILVATLSLMTAGQSDITFCVD